MRQNNAIALMSRIKEKADKLIIQELEARGIEGIVPSHGDIMVLLFDGSDYTMKKLAEKIHRSKPTITVLVDKLVAYGYVFKEKSAKDNRITYIRLTVQGLALEPVFQEISDILNSLVYNSLTETEILLFEKFLSIVNQNFDKRCGC
jgi:DNA-binding MarR family transcriptional regulator